MVKPQDHFGKKYMRVELPKLSQRKLGVKFMRLSPDDVRYIEGEFFEDRHAVVLSEDAEEKYGARAVEVIKLTEKQYKFFAPDQFATEPMTEEEVYEAVILLERLDICAAPWGFVRKKARDRNPSVR